MLEAMVTGIVGGLLLLMMGWLKSDITKIGDRIDTLGGRSNDQIGTLSDRIDTLGGRSNDQIGTLSDRIDTLGSRLNDRIDTLNDRTTELLQITARTEGKLEEHLRQHH